MGGHDAILIKRCQIKTRGEVTKRSRELLRKETQLGNILLLNGR